MRTFSAVIVSLCFSASAIAGEQAAKPAPMDWAAFVAARQSECVGGAATLDTPVPIEVGGHRYEMRGHRLVQMDEDKDRVLRIGVISATKDERPETLKAIADLISKLERAKMDVLVINGDVATHEFNMADALLPALAKTDTLVIAHVGNTESCGSFNRAMEKARAQHPNLVNANWIRQIELDDGVLFTLPGYYDRRFSHSGGSAKYTESDLRDLNHFLKDYEGKAPRVLVSHGPPKMKGKKGIDRAVDVGHVGDPAITKLLAKRKIKFGIFGHILEAGGLASNLKGNKAKRPKRWHSELYVNAGTANPDPWPLLNGKTAYGMGMLVEIRGKKARFKVYSLKRAY